MKLFKSTEVINQREAQTTVELRRLDTVNSELRRKEAELKKLELDFEYVLEKQKKVMADELSVITDKTSALRSEVENLEDRRRQALIPLEEKAKELDKRILKINQKETYNSTLMADLEEKAELLEERLTEVGERKIELDKIAKKQKIAQLAIDQQKESISHQLQEFNNVLAKAMKINQEKEDELAREKAALISLQTMHQEKERYFAEKEEELNNREKGLKDRYETLERTVNKLKLKNI